MRHLRGKSFVWLVAAAVSTALPATTGHAVPMDIKPDSNDALQDMLDNADWRKNEQFKVIVGLLKAGKADEARLRLAQHLSQFPDSAPGLELAGLMLLQQGKSVEAEVSLREALKHDPKRASAATKLAVALMNQGKLGAAEKVLQSLLPVPSEAVHAHYYLGWLLRQTGDVSASLTHFLAYLQASNASPSELGPVELAVAQLFSVVGRYEDVVAFLSSRVSDKPQNSQDMNANILLMSALIQLGQEDVANQRLTALKQALPGSQSGLGLIDAALARQQGDFDRSRNVLNKMVDEQPAFSSTIYYELARTNLADNRSEAAVANLQAAIAGTAPQDLPVLLRDLAGLFIEKGQAESAIQIVRITAERNPEQPWIKYYLGELLTYQGKLQEGETVLSEISAKDPDFAPAHYLQGVIQWNAKRPQEARTSFRQATEAAPTDARSWIALAGTYNDGQHRKEMQQVLDRALEATRQNSAILYQSAVLDDEAGNIEAANAKYRQIISRNPNEVGARNNLALNLAENDDTLPQARQLAGEALNIAGDSPEVQDTYGWLLHRTGNSEEALQYLEKAAASLPDDGIVHYHLGKVYLALGRPEDGRSQLGKALSLGLPGISEKDARSLLR